MLSLSHIRQYCQCTSGHAGCLAVWVPDHQSLDQRQKKVQWINITRTKVILQKAELLWQVHPNPCLYSPDSSIRLMAWLQFATKSSLPQGGQGPHLTQYVIRPHKCTCQMASKSVKQFKQGARMWQTTDRETCRNRRNCLQRFCLKMWCYDMCQKLKVWLSSPNNWQILTGQLSARPKKFQKYGFYHHVIAQY